MKTAMSAFLQKPPLNTLAHLIVAAAVFAKPKQPKIIWEALIGGFLTELSLYALAAWSMFIQGNSPQHVFDVQYFSADWQQIFV